MADKTTLIESLQIDRTEEAQAPSRWPMWLGMLGVAIAAVLTTLWWTHEEPPVVQAAEASTSGATVSNAVAATVPAAAASKLDASGYVVARRSATVSAAIGGRVIEVLISEGSKVNKGDVLARLDDSAYRLQLAEAKANRDSATVRLQAAQVALNNAKPTYERAQRQFDAGYLSPQERDTAKTAYDNAQADFNIQQEAVKIAQTVIDIAQRNLNETVIRAPFSGVITQKNAQPGEILSPSAAGGTIRTGVGTIVDMDSLELEVDVSENYINRVQPGRPATVKLNAYPDLEIPAEVIAIIPTADRAKATVKVRVGFKQRDSRILPEMGARVAFLGDAI